MTPIAKNDSVLSANASKNIWNMANSPAEFIKDNLGLDISNIPNVHPPWRRHVRDGLLRQQRRVLHQPPLRYVQQGNRHRGLLGLQRRGLPQDRRLPQAE